MDGRVEQWETLALRELPEGVWQCLPEIEFCPDPKQQFRASIYGLIGGFEILSRRQGIIESLQGSKNTFERALYEKHRVKLNDLTQEFRNTVVLAKNQLESNFSTLKNSQRYSEIRDYLESIEAGLLQNGLTDVVASELEHITSAVDYLLSPL